MSTLLTNQSAVSRTLTPLTPGAGISGTASLNTSEYFFYSNSPETLGTSDMADSGKFLNRVDVTGNGQIYTWHSNKVGQAIKACILIYNFNSFPVKVNVTNYGITNTSNTGLPDAAAWQSYYNGNSTSITVAAGGYGNLFLTNVPNGNNFGFVARANVTNSNTSAAATVTMFDLAYITNSSSASAFATADATSTQRRRGLGKGFYATLQFPTLSPTNTNGSGITIAASTDFFSGADCSTIVDPSGVTTGCLAGAYGQQFSITIPIKNTTGTARKFRIFIGSRGGNSFPFVSFGSGIASYTTAAAAFTYRDVIETDSIANGASASVKFSTVVTALASTPYLIGARTI